MEIEGHPPFRHHRSDTIGPVAQSSIRVATIADAEVVASVIGDLLDEIMARSVPASFEIDPHAMLERTKKLLENGLSVVLLAEDSKDDDRRRVLGLAALSECHAVYAGGTFGVLTELFVAAFARSQGIGEQLIRAAEEYGFAKGWSRLEVTTPPLPQFDRTVAFYERCGFEITGGRKLKRLLQPRTTAS